VSLRGVVAAAVSMLVIIAALLVAPGHSRAATTKTKTALLLGDSLTTETWPDFITPRGWRLAEYAYPGFAPCDWLRGVGDNFYRQMAKHPSAVLIETAGNDFTNCMKVNGVLPAVGSTAYVQRYESALATVFHVAARDKATVILLTPPPLLEPHLGAVLNELMAWAHYDQHVDVAFATRLALSAAGNFALYLPCQKGEGAAQGCVNGQIAVRTVDATYHLHFCPYTKDLTIVFTCAAYSSGQERWAAAAMQLLKALH
jgi:hypothetical protein